MFVQTKIKEVGFELTLKKYSLKAVEDGDYVQLNYCQIDSPKFSPVVKECRGLILRKGSWEVVARPLSRFYNLGEDAVGEADFDFGSCRYISKEDGSLIILWFDATHNRWRINTRGSFGFGEINDSRKTWSELFFEVIPYSSVANNLDVGTTYILELCSLYNKNVRMYPVKQVYLLAAINTMSGEEVKDEELDHTARLIGAMRPAVFNFDSPSEAVDYLETQPDATFEGFVLKDKDNRRIKLKSRRYVALHRLHNNGNVASYKSLAKLIVRGETDELTTYFQEFLKEILEVEGEYAKMLKVCDIAYVQASRLKTRKKQAELIMKFAKHYSAVIFTALDKNCLPSLLSKDLLESFLLKKLTC